MEKRTILTLAAVAACAVAFAADFRDGWRFRREGGEWQTVTIPHDDAIRHNFDPNKYDTGCGALPCFGKAEYEKTFTISPDEWRHLSAGAESWRLEFDGVMAGATVEVNGKAACSRPWGYASFAVPLDGFAKEGENVIRVHINAKERSSRWYTGFGIYRDVRLVKKPADHVVPGSVAIWTESVTADAAQVRATWEMSKGGKREKSFIVANPVLWSPETPHLYTVELGGEMFRYGIRTLRFDKNEGFFLNGQHRQMHGVCLHHDLGVFGAEFEPEAARRQLALLKEMECDAIRTSHNFSAPGLLDLCDEMGFMVMDEAFDEWSTPKVRNGMAKLWDEWHEREIVDFVRRDRNHSCVVMWSAGNELAEDTKPALAALGAATGRELTALFHANDPEGRPVTAGHWKPQTITNGIAEATDVFGANYLPQRYAEFKGRQMIVGTETCSVVSSRGVYAFPIDDKRAVTNQVPSWDMCPMHPNDYIPDVEFAAQDANPHVFGEFVWTGFDYLGEPDPWRGSARSSYFGIFDLCGFPKDRYWLYKAKWRPDEPSAHILPHWNWKAGMKIPVHVYTSGDEAELFVNGVSQGRKRKGRGEYRFVWNDVPFERGEVRVKTWRDGIEWAEDARVTAGAFHHLEWTDESWGEKFVFRTVRAVDEAGRLVPDAAVEVDLPPPDGCEVFGTCNGDAAELRSLRAPKVKTFSGMALVVYKRSGAARRCLDVDLMRKYFDAFAATDEELYPNAIDNAHAYGFLENKVPLFECPDADITRTYYFRWWTYRKHLRKTASGWVVTEFLPPVRWAGAENTISCAMGHHLREGRWLRFGEFMDDYTRFMLDKGNVTGPRSYVCWPAWATLERLKVSGERAFAISMLPKFVQRFEKCKEGWALGRNFKARQDPATGLFSMDCGHEGTECALSPRGARPMVNAAMWAEAAAISRIAALAGDAALARRFRDEAAVIENAVTSRLWHAEREFFTAIATDGRHDAVRELHGYAPFYFGMPLGTSFMSAWKPLMREDGFSAKWGLTFPERSTPGFKIDYRGHECKWNGPSWPYATSVALTALYETLQNHSGALSVSSGDFAALLKQYAAAHVRNLDDGQAVPWIDENQNPFTGDWISRTIILQTPAMRKHFPRERGKDYNHSTFCDLVIAGLCGLVPHEDGRIDVKPLAPPEWDWWCLAGVRYHGADVTILFDREGTRYGRGKGLIVEVRH